MLADASHPLDPALRSALQQELATPLKQADPDARLQQSYSVWRRLQVQLDAEQHRLANLQRPDDNAFATTVAEARMHLALVREGVSTEQVEWVNHRIPAQQLGLLRQWWPTDGQLQDYVRAEDVEDVPAVHGQGSDKLRLSEAARNQFGCELFFNLYSLVAHNLCGSPGTGGNLGGKSGQMRALDRHFDARGGHQNSFERHAASLDELRGNLMEGRTAWPAWQDTPLARETSIRSPADLEKEMFYGSGAARVPLGSVTVHPIFQRLVNPQEIDRVVGGVSADHRVPAGVDLFMKNLREVAVLMTVTSLVAATVDTWLKKAIVGGIFGAAAVVMFIWGYRRDKRDAKNLAIRTLDQRLYQAAQKQLRSVADQMIREIRAFHTNNQGQLTVDVERALRDAKVAFDASKATYAKTEQFRTKMLPACKAHADGMVRAIAGLLQKRGIQV